MNRGTLLDCYWGGRTRTSNLLVNSQALCQLSYTPSVLCCSTEPAYNIHTKSGSSRMAIKWPRFLKESRPFYCHPTRSALGMDVICGLSRTAQNRWGVAQLAERLAVNQEVGGSSPPAPVAIKKSPSVHACSLQYCPVGCATYWQDSGRICSDPRNATH